MGIDERAALLSEKIKAQAREAYRSDFSNPYGDPKYASSILQAVSSQIFQKEIDKIIHERICPCCGQATMGDIDF